MSLARNRLWNLYRPEDKQGLAIVFAGITTLLTFPLIWYCCRIWKDEKQPTDYEKQSADLYNRATKIADTNHDGNLSLDEKIRMYQEMNIPITIPGETRRPGTSELKDYIQKHPEGEKTK